MNTRKALYLTIGIVAGVLIGAGSLVYAAQSIFIVQQGGTGAQTFSTGQLLYGSGTTPIKSVATTSVTCSGSTSCSTFTAIGASPITITSSAGGSSVFASSTNFTAGQLPYATNTNGTPITLGAVSTTSATCSGSLSCTGFTVLGGSPITLSGLTYPTSVGTSSAETATQIPFWTTTSGSPALLSGGNSTFTFTTAANRLNFTYASSTGQISVPAGSATAPSLAVGAAGTNGGLFSSGNTIGLASGGGSVQFDGGDFFPGSNNNKILGIAGTNIWNYIYVNYASTTGVSSAYSTTTSLIVSGTGNFTNDSGSTADLTVGGGSSLNNFISVSGGRAMYGFAAADVNATASAVINSGASKNLDLYVNSAANGTFVSGTPALIIGGQTGTVGNVSIGSTTANPFGKFNIHALNGDTNLVLFSIGSSTPTATSTLLGVSNGGSLIVSEQNPATSTTQVIDWNKGNQQLIKIGTAGVTISFNPPKFILNGATLRLVVCNPDSGTAGTLTFPAAIRWAGGTAPSQTTTAQHCDLWSFVTTQGTSTSAASSVYFGAQSANF